MSPIPDSETTPQAWCGRVLAARTALRGQIRHADPTDPHRYETRLRAVGAELDLLPRQAYQLLVSRQTIVVEGSADCYEVYTTDTLAPRLRTLFPPAV